MTKARHVARTGGGGNCKRSVYRAYRPEGKYWENASVDGYNKINLKRIKQDSVNWIDLAQNRAKWQAVANRVMNLRVP